MEFEELKTLWQKLDSKLDSLGKINKKMIFESVTNDRQKELNWERYRSIAGVIIGPLGITVILLCRIKFAYFDWKLMLGILFVAFYVSYSIFMNIKSIFYLKSIDLNNDSILQSAKKINRFKDITNDWLRFCFLFWPFPFIGLLLVFWSSFIIDYKLIIFIVTAFIISFNLKYKNYKVKQSRFEKLEKDILELKEYLQ